MYDPSSTIHDFLNAAAAKQPAPGGGSVTALVGALAAAMGEMVLNYSVGKKGLEAHADEFRHALGEFGRARRVLLQLMVEDQLGYQALTAARKLPEGSAERAEKFPAALAASIRAPQAMGATALAVLELCDRVAATANHYLLSDLAVSADLAMATVRCAAYNVWVNLPDVPDEAERRRLEDDSNQLISRAIGIVQRVSPRIWARHAKGS